MRAGAATRSDREVFRTGKVECVIAANSIFDDTKSPSDLFAGDEDPVDAEVLIGVTTGCAKPQEKGSVVEARIRESRLCGP